MPTVALYPHRFYDPITRRWHRARYVARLSQIAENGRPFQITGAPEMRELGGAWSGSAGHVQSSPAPSGNLPSDLVDGSELVRSGPSGESAAGGGDSEASGDDPVCDSDSSVNQKINTRISS